MRSNRFFVCALLLGISMPFSVFSQRPQSYTSKNLPDSWSEDSCYVQKLPIYDDWWKSFEDPMLDTLITIAISNNNNLLIAEKRIRMAKAQLRIQQGSYAPVVQLSGGWVKAQNSGTTTSQTLPVSTEKTDYGTAQLSTSWEIDLFGSIRNRVKSQKELYAASQDEYNAVMVALCAQVADAYATLRTLQHQYQVAEKNIASQQVILGITQARYNSGLVSQLDVSQAKSIYFSTRSTLPSIRTGIDQAIHTIALLLGLFPDEMKERLSVVQPLPLHIQGIAVGIPADLLRQRPDVRSAERNVASSAALVGASKSDWLPKFYVKGSVGFSSHESSNFFNHNSLTYQIAPTVTWTLFQGTQLVQATRAAREQLDADILQFNEVVLTAVQEVENAMSAYTSAIEEEVMLKEVVYQGKETLKLSLRLYKEGLSSFQNVLDAQRSLLGYENSLVSAQGNALSALIQLYKSLGGGWMVNND